MPTPEARRGRVGHLFGLLAGSVDLEDFVLDLAHAAAHDVEHDVSCGLIAQVEGRPVIIASTDEVAAELDRVQDAVAEGPGLDAIAVGEPVEVTDVGAVRKWQAWRSRALAHGVRKSLSQPLISQDGILGALNMYSVSTVPFTAEDREAAASFGEHAAGALTVAIRLAALAELTRHLETALQSRAVIDQAKGILMAQERCTADRAFDILRKASQTRNVKLRDVAAAVVARVTEEAPRLHRHR